MKKWLKKHLKNEKGLTLVELLAVIVILGIIAAIAVPSIGKIIDNTRDKAVLADAANILSAAKLANAEGSCKSDIECDKADLTGLVEGVDAEISFGATKDSATGKWTVEYGKLEKIKNDKFKDGIKDNKVEEDHLYKLMGNKKPATP